MLEFCRKHDGAISVFLTLILIPTLLFGGVVVDGVRIFGSKNIISGAGGMAMNGALANYDGSLNDAYGLIAMSKTPTELSSNLQDYFEASLNANGLTTKDFNRALIELELLEEKFQVMDVKESAVYQTAVMKQEVLEYMKYRAPVTLVNRGIIAKLDKFKNIQKEKEAVDSQIKFESELEELQGKFDGLLDEVERQEEVYRRIRTTPQISSQMQKTKDNYLRMVMLGIAYDRLCNCPEAIEGDLLGLIKSYNIEAESCGQGLDGFASLLQMEKLSNGMNGDPNKLTQGLDPKSDQYKEVVTEINKYEKNMEMWADQVLKIENEYKELSASTKSELVDIYADAMEGLDSAEKAEEKLAELKERLEKCSVLYQKWKGKVAALPSDSEYKTPMQEEVDKEVYKTLFDDQKSDEFANRLEINKNYYQAVCDQLEELSFAGKKAVETEGKKAIDPVAQSASGNVNSQAELSTTAKTYFTANWAGNYQLSVGAEKVSLEDTKFVEFLRENANSKKNKGDPGQKNATVKEWNEKLGEALKDYKTLFTSDDIDKINIPEAGKNDIPSVWLHAESLESSVDTANPEGDMSKKSGRKKASDSASDAMNTNNASLSLISGLGDKVWHAAEDVYIVEYVLGMLSYYTVNRDASGNVIENPLSLSNVSLKDHAVYRAEVEYVIWGSKNSRDNVTKTKALIFAIQFVCNAIYAFTQDPLTEDAARIAAFFPVGPLAKTAIKTALLSVVTIIETTEDLKQLTVDGEAVPLIKKKGGWETWLIKKGPDKEGGLEMRYDDFLWLILFITTLTNQQGVLARTADCIELNRTKCKAVPDKTLHDMYTMVQIQADVKTETFFLQRIAGQNNWELDENAFVIHYNGMQGY